MQTPAISGKSVVTTDVTTPFQRNWKNGDANFPTNQAIDWMKRVVNAGGFYTWAVARDGGLLAAPQFNQLLEMDVAMEQVDISPRYIEVKRSE
jgi:hypothetical protein